MLRYVRRDLVRNPRRTLASLVGVTLGVGLFSAVLFFIDGSGASMTKRALAPLALDQQRVLPPPLGADLRFRERISGPASLRRGQTARLTLTVENRGTVPAHEVVIDDEPPPPLAYVPGSTTRGGRPIRDMGGGNPLAQGLARTGLNVGTLRAKGTLRLSYLARTQRPVPSLSALRVQGKISSREDVVPRRANTPPPLTIDQLRRRAARLPGVAAADELAFVDLPPGSLRAGGGVVRDPVRLFAFNRRYQEDYPSIRMSAGGLRPGGAVLSAEASRALAARPGARVELRLPGRPGALSLPVTGVADLSRAKPLFYSRKTTELEDFLYVPGSIVVDPATFEREVIPAFRSATAAQPAGTLKSFPLLEVDVRVDRSRLRSDPGNALAQTRAAARAVERVGPGQGYLIDNVSNALQVARDDARVAKRMFLFLGLPGILLAAFLAAYAGHILAGAQRREHAALRVRGAHAGHLRRILLYRTLALAGAGSLAGVAIGLVSVIVVLGSGNLSEAASGALLRSGAVAVGAGMLATGLALYVPGRRSLRREIALERAELSPAGEPAWRRLRLDYGLLAAAALAEVIALRAGAFDAPSGSVFQGRAVSLPSHLLLAPLIAWFGGTLLCVRIFQTLASRFPLPAPPRFGSLVHGTVGRSLRRRSWSLATGVVGVGLVVAFGMSLVLFGSSYDSAKAADARFVVGSDIRVTPSVLGSHPLPPAYASRLRMAGVADVTPVVFKLDNSVLIGPDNQNRENLAAVDPGSFGRVTGAGRAAAALRGDPRGLLVNRRTAEDLSVAKGDRVQVLLARGTKRQTLRGFRVAGLFDRLPGFPEGVQLVVSQAPYSAATHPSRADFFLLKASGAPQRAVAALRSGPGRRDPLDIETTRGALDKDQSSLTALNVHALVDLDSFYTLLMAAAAIAIFVFGLMLQRRREYVTMRAQGMQVRELRALVLAEAGLVAGSGILVGLAVGTGMAYLLVHVLRPLFILDPPVAFPAGQVASLAGLTTAATLASGLAATAILRRLRPAELLREG